MLDLIFLEQFQTLIILYSILCVPSDIGLVWKGILLTLFI